MAETTSTTATKPLVGNVKDLLGAAKAATRKVGKEMDKDAFLKLLVTQLKNQDPMKPMQDTEFIAQMAQFSSLEQMQNMNKLLEGQTQFQTLAQASGMIGKQVTLVKPGESAETVTGVVSEVRQAAGKVNVVVNGEVYDATTISNVSGEPKAAAAPAATPAAAPAAAPAASPAATPAPAS